jgi:predicted RND superfamily exporter protein
MVMSDSLSAVENDKIQFYILLTETYLSEMDFLAYQIKESQPVETVSSIATLFRQVGREQVSELPKMIENIKKNSPAYHN